LAALFHAGSVKWTWLFQNPATMVLPVQSMIRLPSGIRTSAALPDRGDHAAGGHDDGVFEGGNSWRGVDLGARENERLGVSAAAGRHRHREGQQREKCGAHDVPPCVHDNLHKHDPCIGPSAAGRLIRIAGVAERPA
jgi:hypothetical protein